MKWFSSLALFISCLLVTAHCQEDPLLQQPSKRIFSLASLESKLSHNEQLSQRTACNLLSRPSFPLAQKVNSATGQSVNLQNSLQDALAEIQKLLFKAEFWDKNVLQNKLGTAVQAKVEEVVSMLQTGAYDTLDGASFLVKLLCDAKLQERVKKAFTEGSGKTHSKSVNAKSLPGSLETVDSFNQLFDQENAAKLGEKRNQHLSKDLKELAMSDPTPGQTSGSGHLGMTFFKQDDASETESDEQDELSSDESESESGSDTKAAKFDFTEGQEYIKNSLKSQANLQRSLTQDTLQKMQKECLRTSTSGHTAQEQNIKAIKNKIKVLAGVIVPVTKFAQKDAQDRELAGRCGCGVRLKKAPGPQAEKASVEMRFSPRVNAAVSLKNKGKLRGKKQNKQRRLKRRSNELNMQKLLQKEYQEQYNHQLKLQVQGLQKKDSESASDGKKGLSGTGQAL